MGKQAKRRGTYEQRKEAAIKAEQERLAAIEAKKQLLYRQEGMAHELMVWWQEDMSRRRYERYTSRRTKDQMMLAQLFGMAYGAGWGTFGSSMFR